MNSILLFNAVMVFIMMAGVIGCQTTNLQQADLIDNAYKNKTPLYISSSNKKPEWYQIRRNVMFDAFEVSTAGQSNPSLMTVSNIKYISSDTKNPQGFFPFVYNRGEIGIFASLISSNNDNYKLVSKDRYDVTLVDKSKLAGKVAGIDYKKNEIVIETRYKNYSLPANIIFELIVFKIDAKVVLLDGSTRVGELIKDDGNEIKIKSILGEEIFNRKEVLKIEYQR